ncbi:hypothetical protein [Aeromicrobium sp.]|uniref:hypothetical protein n=1 Tax=Aeromicrobium sp. TaxID=1871063 RepID=UPI0019A5B3BC|nr:hypothetical protein [Aeromicrobium sp.]MBC7631525.1 hypothetical protein [Aeromicrobium sp.]
MNGQVGDVGAAVRATAGGALLNEEHLSGFEGELLGYDNADQSVADGEIPSCLP